jgi:hypothetical protein
MAAVIHVDAALRSSGRIAQGRRSNQAASVDRPEGHTSANRRVDGGVQLRLIIDSVQPQAAGEIEQGLLLIERAQHPGGCLQRRKLAIRVENVELGIVLPESRTVIGGGGVIHRVGVLVFTHGQGFDDALQPVAVVCEILHYLNGATLVPHERHQVRGRHLRGNEFARRVERP